MFFKKEGFPEEEELVLCTVNNIQMHSVFCKMDEYDKIALIHISEIAPGRIRNIRDYVVEGKKVVCKVMRVDKKTGHVDLSLRRVNENQKKKKIEEVKIEQKAEKIVEQVAKQNKTDPKSLYDLLKTKVFEKYSDLTSCFKEVITNNSLLETLGVDKKIASELTEIIKIRFKPEEVVIGGELELQSYEPNGLEIIKKALLDTIALNPNIVISYEGGGKYRLLAKSDSYKDAEKLLDAAIKKALSFTEQDLGKGEFIRKEKKKE